MSKKDKKIKNNQDKFDPTQNLPKDKDGNLIGGPGRPKGSLNKATRDRREWIEQLLQNNEQAIEDAIKTLHKEDPDKALKHLMGLLEFTTPKLARSEITGPDNGPVELFMVKRLGDPEDDEKEGNEDDE